MGEAQSKQALSKHRGKAVVTVAPDKPASQVTRAVLGDRLQTIPRLIALAAEEAPKDVEHIHRLRVACRRATAAVAVYRPLLQKKPKGTRRVLREIRQAAGPARDADVLATLLADREAEPFLSEVALPKLRAEREAAQAGIAAIAKKNVLKRYHRVFDKAVQLIPEDGPHAGKTYAEFGAAALLVALSRFEERSKLPSTEVEQIHVLRIAGKQLRYSLELFAVAVPDDLFETVYPEMKALQDRLGLINDHASAQVRYQRWLGEMPPNAHAALAAEEIIAEHRRAEEAASDFVAWWNSEAGTELHRLLSDLQGRLSG